MIERIPSGKWRVRVYHQGKCVATQSFELKKDATSWELEQKRKLVSGGLIDPRRGTTLFGDVAARYLEVVEGVVNPKTFDTDRDNLRKHIVPALGGRPVGAVTSGELDNLYAALIQGGLASRTVGRIRDSAAAVFNWAVRQGAIDVSPVLDSKVPATKRETEDVRPFTALQLERTLEAQRLLTPHYAAVTEFSALTGLRWGELVALRVGDLVQSYVPTLTVRKSASDGYEEKGTKSAKVRRVPLDEPAIEIAERRAFGRAEGEYMFAAPLGGRMNGGNLKRATRWTQTAPGHRFHDLRHTAATNWLGAGIEVTTVSKWLGHSTPSVTLNIYSHYVSSASDNAALELLRLRRNR